LPRTLPRIGPTAATADTVIARTIEGITAVACFASTRRKGTEP
jgi:hypothetical protein